MRVHLAIALGSFCILLLLGCGGRGGGGAAGDGPQSDRPSDSGLRFELMTDAEGRNRVLGTNDPHTWCGRDGAWRGLAGVGVNDTPHRIDQGVIDCPPSGPSAQSPSHDDIYSCATRVTTSPCTFSYAIAADVCASFDCETRTVFFTQCHLELPTPTIARGTCHFVVGASEFDMEGSATWLSE